ncbi:MAG: ribosomal protein S18-alanine N-acetyltransferase [Anaerolineales bacterium]
MPAIQELFVRRMEEKDIPHACAIDIASSALPWSEHSLRFELNQNPAARLWVAEMADEMGEARVVGLLVLWIIVDEVHIANIAVHPDFRRRRIGQRLLAKGLLSASEEGARSVFLEVRRGNLAAQSLYRRFGFIETGIRPRYYRDNREDAVLMSLESLQPDLLHKWEQDTL